MREQAPRVGSEQSVMDDKGSQIATLPSKPRVAAGEDPSQYWFARHSKSIIFLILTLAAVGIYEALSLPIAVFPATNFPRIIIGVDNGVMPIEQMEVTITRPIEEAVNSVPGLQDVHSITSRGSAEVDLDFDWTVDMTLTLQHVNSAMARMQTSLAVDGANRNSPARTSPVSRSSATALLPTRFRNPSCGSWPPTTSSRG